MFNSVWAMTNSCNILGPLKSVEGVSVGFVCTVSWNGFVTVPQHGDAGQENVLGWVYSIPVVNQFFSIGAVQSYTKTLIHCMLLTYLASLPSCFSAFKWQPES